MYLIVIVVISPSLMALLPNCSSRNTQKTPKNNKKLCYMAVGQKTGLDKAILLLQSVSDTCRTIIVLAGIKGSREYSDNERGSRPNYAGLRLGRELRGFEVILYVPYASL
jgi:hypothetical protein